MVGALTGLAFGHIATGFAPAMSGSETLYALAGMGAVAAAVLGAPISTTLIVFELTGDWQTGIAVMASVSLSTALASRLVDRSFFLTQLELRGIRLAAGPQQYLLALFRVASVMKGRNEASYPGDEACLALIARGASLPRTATLERAMPMFEKTKSPFLPVLGPPGPDGAPAILGVLFEIDALRAYNKALVATASEEHS